MLLILTNSEDVTADYLVSVLRQHGIRFLRFDTDTMLHRLTFSFDGNTTLIRVEGTGYRPQDFSNVWYRRPERLKHPRFDGSPEGNFVLEE
jgi:hypothetical protein